MAVLLFTPPQRIATVILHYGDPKLSLGLAQSLAAADPDAPLFVLDNAAPRPYPMDGPAFWLRLPQNGFWTSGLNYALEHCKAMGYTHVWFLNNDIRFLEPTRPISFAAQRLAWLARAIGKRVAIYSPAVQHNPYMPHMAHQNQHQALLAPYIDGVAPLLDIACVEELGGLDCADNPLGYSVDVWLSLRAHRAGYVNAIDQRVVIKHSYHTTAATQEGFLSRASEEEDSFMTKRLGPDWRAQLKALATDVTTI